MVLFPCLDLPKPAGSSNPKNENCTMDSTILSVASQQLRDGPEHSRTRTERFKVLEVDVMLTSVSKLEKSSLAIRSIPAANKSLTSVVTGNLLYRSQASPSWGSRTHTPSPSQANIVGIAVLVQDLLAISSDQATLESSTQYPVSHRSCIYLVSMTSDDARIG